MSILEEREHFDRLSRERLGNGFVPDLERMTDNDYFYLSAFRRRALAVLGHREEAEFRLRPLRRHVQKGAPVLDLGCGSGWFSLELARAGFAVTAVDLSPDSIDLARATLKEANTGEGSVEYYAADVSQWEPPRDDYAAISYVGILHHLGDPASVVERMRRCAVAGHYMVAADPLPQSYGRVEAAVAVLVRTLLSTAGAWYERIPIPATERELEDVIEATRHEFAEWADKNERQQSPHNNASDGADNLEILRRHYEILEEGPLLPLCLRIIGGIRLGSEDETVALARFYMDIEKLLQDAGMLKPGGFNVFGRAHWTRVSA